MVFIGYGSSLDLPFKSENPGVKKLGAITSGIGLTLLLVAGFGPSKIGLQLHIDLDYCENDYLAPIRQLVAFINRKPEWAKLHVVDYPLTGFHSCLMVYFFKS